MVTYTILIFIQYLRCLYAVITHYSCRTLKNEPKDIVSILRYYIMKNRYLNKYYMNLIIIQINLILFNMNSNRKQIL
jgi:hypothetical protein